MLQSQRLRCGRSQAGLSSQCSPACLQNAPSDLRFQDVARENQKLINDLKEVDRQSSDLDNRTRLRAKENNALKTEYDKAQVQITQQLADLQESEKQMDALGRQLSKREEVLKENEREKSVLVEEVHCLERQKFQQENEITECRRQLAQCENTLETAQARIGDYEKDVALLKGQLDFSHEKVRNIRRVET